MLMRGVSVKETAFNLGYKDQFFFSKQFHQKLGYPPSAINPLNPRGARRYLANEDAAADRKQDEEKTSASAHRGAASGNTSASDGKRNASGQKPVSSGKK